MENIRREVSRLRRDYVHGSSWYFEYVAKLLAKASYDEVGYLYNYLQDIRPGMGSLSNIREAMEGRGVETKEDANQLGLDLLKYLEDAESRMRVEAAKVRIRTALSISHSGAVKLLVEEGGIEKIFLLRSSPGKEYRRAVAEYSKYCDVTVIPDAAMYSLTKDVDAVVTGVDGLYSSGFFTNKLGTAPLCLSARERGVRVIVAGESFKAADIEPHVSWTKVYLGKSLHKVPLFDLVPISFIDELITDRGTFKNQQKGVLGKLHSYFLSTITKE